MDGNEAVSFQLIACSGEARMHYVNAINEARNKNFDEANTLIATGDLAFNQAHSAHASLIQKEANKEYTKIDLLLVHAEDQLMCSETIRLLATQLIEMYKELQ